MIDKFSELIAQGVARFEYKPVAPEVPEQDEICRTYNNVWSIPSDTHMFIDETGTRYITGHMISNKEKWESFKCSCNWGAVNFKTTGWWSLCNFLQSNGLCGNYENLNGELAYALTPIDYTGCTSGCECPNCCVTTESKIPSNISTLTYDGNILKIKECYKGKKNLYEVSESLNENIYVKGNAWTVVNDKLMCPIGNKVVIL